MIERKGLLMTLDLIKSPHTFSCFLVERVGCGKSNKQKTKQATLMKYLSDTSLMELIVESRESPICKINKGKYKCGQLPSTPGLMHNVIMCIRIKLNMAVKGMEAAEQEVFLQSYGTRGKTLLLSC